jgi:arsenate reductase
MAEAILNVAGRERFKAYSAGSHPTGTVSHFALEQIEAIGYSTENLRSKSWDEFAGPDAPHMDLVITVCDKAAGEVCPFWPGQPTTAHWGFQDPAAVNGSDAEMHLAFAKVCREIKTRLDIFQSLPINKLDKLALKRELDSIGETRP